MRVAGIAAERPSTTLRVVRMRLSRIACWVVSVQRWKMDRPARFTTASASARAFIHSPGRVVSAAMKRWFGCAVAVFGSERATPVTALPLSSRSRVKRVPTKPDAPMITIFIDLPLYRCEKAMLLKCPTSWVITQGLSLKAFSLRSIHLSIGR
jgi:hypothetical protein